MRNKVTWFVGLFLLLLAGCGASANSSIPIEEDLLQSAEATTASEWLEKTLVGEDRSGTQLDELPAHIDENLSHLHSVLVVQGDELVYEHYVGSRDENSADFMWSVTKSFTAALIGIAIDDGLIDSVDQPLSDFYTAEQLAESDERLADVTLRELLTMTSGSWCGNDGCHDSTLSASLGRELRNEPGSTFMYDTGASHLLSGVLSSATGMSEEAYAEQEIFVPLGIDDPLWETDAEGNNFGGKGLHLRPRDMAKFGMLLLDEGEWQGEQLISAEFIAAATQNQVAEKSAEDGYGYLVWTGETDGYAHYAAVGYGGQYIHVIPDLDLVTVITSNFNRPWPDNASIIAEFIVPAITSP